MSDLADRHTGTLDGILSEIGKRTATVAVNLEPSTVEDLHVQHAAWMLTNLLARQKGVVAEVLVSGADSALLPRVQPGSPPGASLADALVNGGGAIGGVPVSQGDLSAADIILTIGPGGPLSDGPPLGWRVHGEGLCGAIAAGPIAAAGGPALPFGPYVAACLAAGEVFRAVRIPSDRYEPTRRLSYSLWDHTTGPGEIHEPGPPVGPLILDFGMAGVGAVGTALAQTVWACPQLAGCAVIADADRDGIDTTNLNRCVIFNASHVGRLKASTAAEVLADCDIEWQAVDGPYDGDRLPRIPSLLVSAVDTNRSRHALQQAFWPGRLIAASTYALRAELLRCGPPGVGPCLCCHNPLEIDVPDDVHREQLRTMTKPQLAEFAAGVGHPVKHLRRWAQDGECGQAGDAALARLREQQDKPPAMFSVGFVSVLAGTMLAAQVLKEHAGHSVPLNDNAQSAKLQLVNPTVARNGLPTAVQRDPRCPACSPEGQAVAIWRERAASWQSGN
jgi:ThiF family protein